MAPPSFLQRGQLQQGAQDTVWASSPGITGAGHDLTGSAVCPAWPEAPLGGTMCGWIHSEVGGGLCSEKLFGLKIQTGYRKVRLNQWVTGLSR